MTTTPEYVRDFLAELIRDYARDNFGDSFDDYSEVVEPLNGEPSLVFTDPDTRERFKVTVTEVTS